VRLDDTARKLPEGLKEDDLSNGSITPTPCTTP
jgi:hypothetical protein